MPKQPMPQTEFIAMMATLFAIVAFSIDGMLPALPRIAAELTPDDVNAAQLIVTSFVLGMGVGTLFAGPISDTIGRKPAIIGGVAIYILGAALAPVAGSLELLLAARILQGVGAAGPRIVTLAMVRDLHSGRQMARIVSFAMMIFTLVPAVAPSVGAVIIAGFGWRGIFGAVIVFSLIGSLWLVLRQPETLPKPRRRPLRLSPLGVAAREVMSHRLVVTSIAVQTLVYGALFGTLSSTQQIFDISFGRAESFPIWFAVIALISGGASLLNATLVVRLGMRLLITVTLGGQILLSSAMAALMAGGVLPDWLAFPAYLVWTISVFFMTGLTLGNLNALALEPLGHIAGMAASVNGCISTVLAVAIAAPIGLAFNGTPVPLMVAVAALCAAGWGLMRTIPRYY
ncbi:MAG: MFS transporter [Rhodobacteraceae bacterium]|nr:MFS transporter [Paracoccaceae bacterium]